ncbi:hypothetical protein B0H13DRAFT_1876025 [Mycena leptocephala]|nr:hypothetical protein B0H13DRAFT_1876025 [Mycena leptocephala]
MIDLTYILLLSCLAATNLSRIIQGFRWVYEYISTPRTPRLVPYFNRRALSRPIRSGAPLSGISIAVNAAPPVWDGRPDGQFQCLFTPQQVTDTDQLAVNWVCEALSGHRGLPTALTWQKGKEIHRRCVGVLECSSQSCAINLRGAPAIRGVDLHRQLQMTCLCGEAIRLKACGIELSTFLFRGGAFFINSGDHTHGRHTHSLIYRPNEPSQLEEYMVKRPISLYDTAADESDNNTSTSSRSQSGSEWRGIHDANDSDDDKIRPLTQNTNDTLANNDWELDLPEFQEQEDDPEAAFEDD